MKKNEAVLKFYVLRYVKSYLLNKFNSTDDHIYLLDRRTDTALSVLLHLITTQKKNYSYTGEKKCVDNFKEKGVYTYRNQELTDVLYIHFCKRSEYHCCLLDEKSMYWFNKMMDIRIFDELAVYIKANKKFNHGQLQSSVFEFLQNNGILESDINYLSVLRKVHRFLNNNNNKRRTFVINKKRHELHRI